VDAFERDSRSRGQDKEESRPGHVALFDIEDESNAAFVAVRQQLEDDSHGATSGDFRQRLCGHESA
jgi:hypothetical protein